MKAEVKLVMESILTKVDSSSKKPVFKIKSTNLNTYLKNSKIEPKKISMKSIRIKNTSSNLINLKHSTLEEHAWTFTTTDPPNSHSRASNYVPPLVKSQDPMHQMRLEYQFKNKVKNLLTQNFNTDHRESFNDENDDDEIVINELTKQIN